MPTVPDGGLWMRSRCAGSGASRTTGERRDKPAWRRDLRTSYIEGVAIHDDLESCVGAREDAGEALTEGDVGWVIEPRKSSVRGADAVPVVGRQHRWPRYRELSADPARSESLCMRCVSKRENREVPRLPVWWW